MSSLRYRVINSSEKICEQISLYSSAKKIVALYGSALMNLVWCQRNINVIELLLSDYMSKSLLAISRVRSANNSWINYGKLSEGSINMPMLKSFV
jgi:capsular polysaccharide biosynthesis protein